MNKTLFSHFNESNIDINEVLFKSLLSLNECIKHDLDDCDLTLNKNDNELKEEINEFSNTVVIDEVSNYITDYGLENGVLQYFLDYRNN